MAAAINAPLTAEEFARLPPPDVERLIVDPENRELSIYRPQQRPLILTEGETVTGEDVLPGFTCRVAELLP